jgi:NDP-sugar pyrophosphorylase family protein
MIYALIAAGEGSRLSAEGVTAPKPLVKVDGTPLLERLLNIFIDNDAEAICVIINERMVDVRAYLQNVKLSVPLHLIVKSTPDSFTSFRTLAPLLQGADKFCLTTVDPIFRPEEFSRYINEFRNSDSDALMAVTDYIDDEKPLYVKTDETLRITGYANDAYEGFKYISGGIYCMNAKALSLLPEATSKGVSRMRGFQQFMVDSGLEMRAYPFKKIIDIDHAADIAKAEAFLREYL